jgi:iron complex outermembrane recepter protein
MKRYPIFCILCSIFALFSWSFAQDNSEDDNNPVYELNPFEVDESSDVGYLAANTLSGTRFNSSLRDTSASVSVFTQEFLDDTGLKDINELINYSLSTVLDTDDQDGDGGGANTFLNSTTTTQRIRTRGVESSRGVDYFKSITPDDSYRIGRYDDARGPNGVLFGISYAGGLINQTSLVANTYQDSGRVEYSFGNQSRNRAEFRYNKVLIEDKLAILVAGVTQNNGGWRQYDFQDKDRIFGTLTYRPIERLTIRANYETGNETRSNITPFHSSDQSLPFYDNLLALGLDAVTFAPSNKNPNAAQRALGITGRDGNFNNTVNRFTYIDNDGTFFNAVGTYLTGGYDDPDVRAPDGTPGQGGRYIRINDPDFLPYYVNAAGPAVIRDQDLDNYTITADLQITDHWFCNASHGFQDTEVYATQTTGSQPELRADPNTTLGSLDAVRNPNPLPNPYAGQFFYDGAYRKDHNHGKYEETRISTSFEFDFADKFENAMRVFGNHKLAVAVSESDEYARRNNTNLALGGNPANSPFFQNANNQISVRHYVTDINDYNQFRLGDWRDVPDTIATDRFTPGVMTSYPVVWAESAPGNINYLVNQLTKSKMAVTQSRFWDNRVIATFGYREDSADIDRYGFVIDPLIGHIPDPTNLESTTEFDGVTRTKGIVFRVTDNISLLANSGSNIGIPDFRRTVFPDGTTSPPPKGDGEDYGVDFNFFDNRINGRAVYYTTNSIQEVVGGSQAAGQKSRIYEAFGSALSGSGRPYTVDEWAAREPELDPSVNGYFRDNVSSGYELRITANITENWRLVLNASKTDRIVSNSFSKAIEWYGLTEGADGLVVQGATQVQVPDPEDPENSITKYNVDPDAYTSDGAVAKYLAFGQQSPDADINTLVTTSDLTIAEEIFDVVDAINERREIDEKRWGLRPYRFNVFTSYDIKDGPLKGFSFGGGYRWQSANILGEENGVEFEGKALTDTDLMLRYRTSFKGNVFKGRLTIQANVVNVFDKNGIIPVRLAGDGDISYMIPGGRGIAYTRYDFIDPREVRLSLMYDF